MRTTKRVVKRKSSSSDYNERGFLYSAQYDNDGNIMTRWSSDFSDEQWIQIDLGEEYTFSRMNLIWEVAYANLYFIETSSNGTRWRRIYETRGGNGDIDAVSFPNTYPKFGFEITYTLPKES